MSARFAFFSTRTRAADLREPDYVASNRGRQLAGRSIAAPRPSLARLLRCATQNLTWRCAAPSAPTTRRAPSSDWRGPRCVARDEADRRLEQRQLFAEGRAGARSMARSLPFELGGGDELKDDSGRGSAPRSGGLEVRSTANALAAAAAAEEDAADAVERPKRPRASEEEQADTRLLSDAAVLLSCIGVAYALQSVLEQARRGPPPPTAPRAPTAHPALPRPGGRRRRGGQGPPRRVHGAPPRRGPPRRRSTTRAPAAVHAAGCPSTSPADAARRPPAAVPRGGHRRRPAARRRRRRRSRTVPPSPARSRPPSASLVSRPCGAPSRAKAPRPPRRSLADLGAGGRRGGARLASLAVSMMRQASPPSAPPTVTASTPKPSPIGGRGRSALLRRPSTRPGSRSGHHCPMCDEVDTCRPLWRVDPLCLVTSGAPQKKSRTRSLLGVGGEGVGTKRRRRRRARSSASAAAQSSGGARPTRAERVAGGSTARRSAVPRSVFSWRSARSSVAQHELTRQARRHRVLRTAERPPRAA